MMQMTFYQSVHVSLWFDAWTSDSLLTYVVLLMGVSAFAVGHEGLHRFRQACSLVSRYDGILWYLYHAHLVSPQA